MSDYKDPLEELARSEVLYPAKGEDPVLYIQRVSRLLRDMGEDSFLNELLSVLSALAAQKHVVATLGQMGLVAGGPDIDAQIEALRDLDDGWDPKRPSVAPLQETIDEVEWLVRQCTEVHGLEAPWISALATGGVQAMWCWPDGKHRALLLFDKDSGDVTGVGTGSPPLVTPHTDPAVVEWLKTQLAVS